MKELTIEQKAKRYDDLLVRLQEAKVDNDVCDDRYCCVIDVIVPELKESEDERIRKCLIDYLYTLPNHFSHNGGLVTDWIAWLEKQGEQKSVDKVEPRFKVGDKVYALRDRFECTIESIDELTYYGDTTNFDIKDQDNWKLVEQKPTDKVEPKFKVGDWCIDNEDGVMFKIVRVLDNTYIYETTEGKEYSCTHYSLENDAKLWTIQDAKPGDVVSDGTTVFIFKDLLSDGSVMSYCDYDTDSGESDAFCPLSMNLMCSKITPATKEQHDTLERAITNAGYRWDAEKKELKKLGQPEVTKTSDQEKEIIEIQFSAKDSELQEAIYNIPKVFHAEIKGDSVLVKKGKQKPEWSEDDKEHVESILERLEGMCKKGATFTATRFAVSQDIDWLKSLKDRLQPKREWSEYDKWMLESIIYNFGKGRQSTTSQDNWLKSLAPWSIPKIRFV